MNRNARCYNSGKIGGLPYEEVRKKFARANNEIRNMGMIPVSPLSNGLKPSRPWLLHMAADLCIMAGCRHIFMQDDWRNSRGARIEYRTARLLRMNIWFQVNPGYDANKEIILNVTSMLLAISRNLA